VAAVMRRWAGGAAQRKRRAEAAEMNKEKRKVKPASKASTDKGRTAKARGVSRDELSEVSSQTTIAS